MLLRRNIKSLPFSILVSPYQRIVRFDLKLDDAGELIDSLTTKHDNNEKKKEEDKNKKKKKGKIKTLQNK